MTDDGRTILPIRIRGTRRAGVRLAVVAALAVGLLLVSAGAAAAHPLGNFTVNQYAGLRLLPDRVEVDYVVDMAEIPAFQTRQEIDADGDQRVSPGEADAWRSASCQRLAGGLVLRLDVRRLDLVTVASRLSFPPGSGGLPTLRLECGLATVRGQSPAARTPAGGALAGWARRPLAGGTLTLTNGNYSGRVGWREVTAVGDGTTVTSSDVPAASASARLTSYPKDLLRSPLDQRAATVSFRPGGTATGAASKGGGPGAAPRQAAVPMAVDRATRAFTELVARQRLGPAFGALAVALALLLGAAHALAPGHGKTIMAAYLLGLRSSLSQALLVASTVTLTHTAGVLALGIALSASTALAPERLYPWLGLASGLLLAFVGVTLLRRALRTARHRHAHAHAHLPGHAHPDPPGHTNPPVRALDHHRPPGWRSLVSMGFAGGLVPSPSALVVLLGAIALGRAWFGVLLVLAYGAGMALTLTGSGMLLVRVRSALDRRAASPARARVRPRLGLAGLSRALPLASATAIIAVGLYLAAQGVSGI